MRSDNLLSDGTFYISHAFQIVERARPKQCSKSTIALFLANVHLRQFYLLLYILAPLIPITTVKAQVRDLHYNSSNLCANCIIRHMLTKWTDHPPGIYGWGVRMALKRLGIRMCVSSRIGFMHVYHSMYFHYLLLFVIHVLLLDKLGDLHMYHSLSVTRCISAEPLYACQTVGIWIGEWLPN